MPSNPIGVTFIPSADNQAMGPQRGALEGPSGNLGQAFKILNLHLPRVLGQGAPAPEGLLRSQGSAGVAGGGDPYAAVFAALLKAMAGGAGGTLPGGGAGTYGLPNTPRAGGMPSMAGGIGAPKIDYTDNTKPASVAPVTPPGGFKDVNALDPTPAASSSWLGNGGGGMSSPVDRRQNKLY
jgi:hypothetical protein